MIAVATVNLTKVGSGLISGVSHWRFGNIRWSWVPLLVFPGLVGSVMGALLLINIPDDAARLWVPVLLLIMGLLILSRFLSSALAFPPVSGASAALAAAASGRLENRVWTNLAPHFSRVGIPFIGFVGGVLNSTSGAYGPFTTSSVLLAKGGHPRYVVGTVNFVEMFVASAASVTLLSQMDWSGFRWSLPLVLMAGSILTAPFGAYLSRHLPEKLLGLVVGLTLIFVNAWSILRVIL